MSYKYNIFKYKLDNALSEAIEVAGGFVYVKDATDLNVTIQIQPDSQGNDLVTLKKQYGFVAQFKKLYLSASAQAGKEIEIIVTDSYDNFRIFEQAQSQEVSITEKIIEAAGSVYIYNISTAANQEYSQALPPNTFKFTIKARGGPLQVTFSSGQSNTIYILLNDGMSWSEDNVLLTNKTLYFQNRTTNGVIAEIIAWTL